jgi:hypothetical protein
MRITKQVLGRSTQFSGDDVAGWLPAHAAGPESTAFKDLMLDIRIIEAEGGYIFAWQSRTTNEANDTWHESIEEALQEAHEKLGIKATEWEDVNEEFEGEA